MARKTPGEGRVKTAIRWISDRRRENPTENTTALVDEASRRFDLSPLEEEQLVRTITSEPADQRGLPSSSSS